MSYVLIFLILLLIVIVGYTLYNRQSGSDLQQALSELLLFKNNGGEYGGDPFLDEMNDNLMNNVFPNLSLEELVNLSKSTKQNRELVLKYFATLKTIPARYQKNLISDHLSLFPNLEELNYQASMKLKFLNLSKLKKITFTEPPNYGYKVSYQTNYITFDDIRAAQRVDQPLPNLVDVTLIGFRELMPNVHALIKRCIKNIKKLTITNCHLNDMLDDLSSLEELEINQSVIDHLAAMPKLKKLKFSEITMYHTIKFSETYFDNLNNLEELHITKCECPILTKNIHKLVNLKVLRLQNIYLDNNTLEQLTNLEQLSLFNVNNVTGIKTLSKLKYLSTDGVAITDNDIKNLVNLEYLQCKSPITDDAIKNLVNLKTLIVRSPNIFSNEGIKRLTNLDTLNIMASKVITDDGIKNLNELTWLAPNTLISSDVIISMPKLQEIKFYKKPYDTYVMSQDALQQIAKKGIKIYLEDNPILFN